MDSAGRTYHEDLFQWIWAHLKFDVRNLKTVCGKDLKIIRPGSQNMGGGPDFLNAHLAIEGTEWHGSIEIHKLSSHWEQHGHQHNPTFNNVILHVVYQNDRSGNAESKNGSRPHTLELKPFIGETLNSLLAKYTSSQLPCSGTIHYINQAAFEKQIEQAHREYFSFKTEQLLKLYDPALPVSKAWKQSFIKQIYQTLGASENGSSMVLLAEAVLSRLSEKSPLEEFVPEAKKLAFADNDVPGVSWRNSGMRPAAAPASRVPQAAALHHSIMNTGLNEFLKEGTAIWPVICENVPLGLKPGASTLNLLRQTVFFPAIYLLGDLLQSAFLMKGAYREWLHCGRSVPKSILKPFKNAGFRITESTKKPGMSHHYKRYCLERNCHRCEVFKNAIRS